MPRHEVCASDGNSIAAERGHSTTVTSIKRVSTASASPAWCPRIPRVDEDIDVTFDVDGISVTIITVDLTLSALLGSTGLWSEYRQGFHCLAYTENGPELGPRARLMRVYGADGPFPGDP